MNAKFVSEGYLQECIRALKSLFPTIAVEVGPMEDHQYAELVEAGAEGLIVYQETYDKERYKELHTAGGRKRNLIGEWNAQSVRIVEGFVGSELALSLVLASGRRRRCISRATSNTSINQVGRLPTVLLFQECDHTQGIINTAPMHNIS